MVQSGSAEALLLENYRGRRVLLVEDEFINQEISRSLLEDVALAVDLAENGEEALRMASEGGCQHLGGGANHGCSVPG